MNRLREGIPVLGILALTVLFLKMPEAPNIWGIFKCKACGMSEPYLPLIGGGYFAMLIALSMLFPTFPSPVIARGGLIWALLLAPTLTYLDLPAWCVACLIGHICNIFIWMIWSAIPSTTHDEPRASPIRERLLLTLWVPISLMALFGCLNLTFMVYNLKAKQTVSTTGLQVGDAVPNFAIQSHENRLFANAHIAASTESFINFVSPNCPYCKEQLSILDGIAAQLARGSSYRFINISPALTTDLVQPSTATEWFEDKDGRLRDLFKVSGYPTLFVVGPDNKILQVISGVPTELLTLGLVKK